ncbi:MAG: helix-turn-helix domain-containing protein [Nocardioides sp.]|uniref:PucR family transcriptional regulator n=1 Tax=Nocardioides sp. TaxID=35761 RepID=UPI0039E30A9A
MRRRDPDPRVVELATALLGELDALTDETCALIRNQIDVYRSGSIVSQAQLSTAVRRNVRRVLEDLLGPHPTDPAAAEQTGRERAAQGVPLPDVLRAYRLGFALVWQRLLAAANESGARTTAALLDASAEIWSINDEHSTALTEAYRKEMTARIVTQDRRRSALVAALLTGPTEDNRSAWEISKMLAFPFDGAFLVVVAEAPAIGDRALPRLEERLEQTGVASAWQSQPDREVGIISRGRRRTEADILRLISSSASTRVGVSPEFSRLDRAPRAARFARIALDTLPPGRPGTKQLADTPLSELIITNRDNTRHFVQRALRGILSLPEDDRRLQLATARAWLDAHGSAVEAGRVLYCHENTVRYRIRRLEERLGASLDDANRLAELAAALEALEAFPELAEAAPTDPADEAP